MSPARTKPTLDNVAHHILPPAAITASAATAPLHLRPILRAAAEGRIGFGHVIQHSGRFRFVSTRPIVLIIGDDYDLSFGPAAFHAKSLRRFLRSVGSAVIVSGAPDPRAYLAALASPLANGKDVAIIESRETHEPAWIDLVRSAHPGIPMLISTPGRNGKTVQ